MRTTPQPQSGNPTIDTLEATTAVIEQAHLPPPPIGPDTPSDDRYTEGQADFLPPRPRGRLLRPVTVLLFAALMAGAGFIGGVLVEKHQLPASSSSSTARNSSSASSYFGRSATAGSGALTGQVSTISGNTLYVTDSSGNTIKVTTSSSSVITKITTKTTPIKVGGVHAGDTLTITGTTAKNGTVAATMIRDSGSTGSGSSIYGSGASSNGSGSSSTGSTGTTTSSGSSSLFGP